MGSGAIGGLKRRIATTFQSGVARIAAGSLVGQGVVVVAMPILTRLYTPDQFGLLAVYVSLLSMAAVVACLRFELAIPLPPDDGDAAHLLGLSFLAACAVSVLALFGCILFGRSLLHVIHAEGLQTYLAWVLPLGVLGAGAYQAMSYWAMRQRDYARLARTRAHQGLAQAVTQVGLGFFPWGPLGLLIGADVGRLNGTGTLMRAAWREEGAQFRRVSLQGMKSMLIRYREFPMVSAGSALINAAGLYLPAVLVTAFFDTSVAGQFSLAQRVIAVPMALIGQAIAQVYTAEAAALLRNQPSSLHGLVKATVRKLLYFGVMPVTLLALLGPWGFERVFGHGWAQAGLFVRILTPMYLLQFTAVPVSATLSILERQGLQFIWDASRLVAILVAVCLLPRAGVGPAWTIAAYGFVMTSLYAVMLWMVHRHTAALGRQAHV